MSDDTRVARGGKLMAQTGWKAWALQRLSDGTLVQVAGDGPLLFSEGSAAFIEASHYISVRPVRVTVSIDPADGEQSKETSDE